MSAKIATTKSAPVELAPKTQRAIASPACDVYENADEILVVADLPGVSADALSVHLSGGELTLEGTRQLTAHGGTQLSAEYRDCDFRRRFAVPGGIDPAKISAELRNGVMWLHLPKSEALKPRQIAVRAG